MKGDGAGVLALRWGAERKHLPPRAVVGDGEIGVASPAFTVLIHG